MVLVGSTLDHYLDPNPWTSQKTYYSDVCHKVEAFQKKKKLIDRVLIEDFYLFHY